MNISAGACAGESRVYKVEVVFTAGALKTIYTKLNKKSPLVNMTARGGSVLHRGVKITIYFFLFNGPAHYSLLLANTMRGPNHTCTKGGLGWIDPP